MSKLLTWQECQRLWGAPELEAGVKLCELPKALRFGVIPKAIYCNPVLFRALTIALQNVINRGLEGEIKTWDGCFNIRPKKAGKTPSLHSWGLALDINAAWNGFGKPPTIKPDLVKCFTDACFDWGGGWKKPDGMHFQVSAWLASKAGLK
jgi:hypothetical protein